MKRILLFVLLLVAGAAALRLAIGDEDAVRAVETENPTERADEQNPRPSGITVRQGEHTASITQDGPLHFPRWRDVPAGDGSVRKEEVFVLAAEQSRPIQSGLQELERVTLQLFARGVHAATVRAGKAFVELGRDASGRVSLVEQKAIDVRDAIVEGEPGSRLEGLRLELGDARVQIADERISLVTRRGQPVLLAIAGERAATLRGKGAEVLLLRDGNGAVERAEIEILEEPVLESQGIEVRADGRLRYVENTATGAAQVTLSDEVRLDLERSGLVLPGLAGDDAGEAPGRATARGQRFAGWLLRTGGSGRDERGDATLQRMSLFGSPALIEAPGLRVETPQLTVTPGALGEPYLVTAHGGPSRVEQTVARSGPAGGVETFVGTSPRRVHLIRLGADTGAIHRAFGFPGWTLRPLEQRQIVVFEDRARIASEEQQVSANDGITAVRDDGSETTVLLGNGEVEIVRQKGGSPAGDLAARGSDGFVLSAGADGSRLRLGPADERSPPWRAHAYTLQTGDATLFGRGGCVVVQSGEGPDESTRLWLRAPDDEIGARLPSDGVEFERLRELRATLHGQQLAELETEGTPVRAVVTSGSERLIASAPRIVQVGPRSLRLLPAAGAAAALPEVDRLPKVVRSWTEAATGEQQHVAEVRGPHIDVHHTGGHTALVDAQASAGERPNVYARLPSGRDEPTTIACTAERLRLLPFALPEEIRHLHLGGLGGTFGNALMPSLAQAWLVVDEVLDFQLDDEQHGHLEGRARRLFVSHGARNALFVGSADAAEPAVVLHEQDGRSTTLRGARVRVRKDPETLLETLGSFPDRQLFLAPTMTLHEAGANGLLSHMRAVCRGNIHVRPEAVDFLGPVTAQGLTEDGDDDPEGLHIEADALVMHRAKESGDIVRVVGTDVALDWTRLDARSAVMEIDLVEHTCTARDPDGAVVVLPDGRTIWSPRIEVDYETWSFQRGPGRVTKRGSAPEGER